MRRVLIFGANGQLGRLLAAGLRGRYEVIALSRRECDLAVTGQAAAAVRRARPDVLINAAAYTAVDRAETDRETAMQVNGHSVAEAGAAAAATGARVIHYSTDYVFSGDKKTPYVESDATGPVNSYGATKLAGELGLSESGAKHLILRTSWVYAAEGSNFVQTMLRLGRERGKVRVVADQHGAPTAAEALAEATEQLIKVWDGSHSGVYHCTGSGDTTWAEFARDIFATSGMPEVSVEPIPSSAYPTPAKRPANSRLDCSKLDREFGIRLPGWRESLARVLRNVPEPAQL